ncbi:hypothetical protein BH11ACT5_BH11ACT5_11330 [soil metagenome]
MDPDWIAHRRPGDRELLGWMLPEGDGFVVIDLLGRRRTEAIDWLDAEEALEEIGIGYLADLYELQLDSGEWLRVRLAEVSPTTIIAKKDDFGDMNADQVYYPLGFPMPATLRPMQPLRPLHPLER